VVYGILQPGPDRPDGIPYVRPTEIQNDIIQVADLRRTSKKIAEKYHRSSLEASDIILSIVGTIGKVAVVPPELIGANITQSSARIRLPREFILPRFGAYALRSPLLVNQFNVARLGTAVPRLNLAHVRDLLLPVAPLGEQHRIVEAIESYLTRLDDAVATLERVQRNLKRYRASVLKAAVEGRLVPTEAELARAEGRDYEPASVLLDRILAERRRRWEEAELAKLKAKGKTPKDDKWKARYKDPTAPDVAGLPALPDGWRWASMDQLAHLVRNGYSKKPALDGEVRILRISAVRPMSVEFADARWLPGSPEDYSRDLVEPGDLLFTRYNGSPALVGVSGLVRSVDRPTVHPDKLIKVRFLASELDLAYLELATNTGASRRFVESRTRTTAGQAGISGGDIKQMPVPLPPHAEQTQIAGEAERLLTLADSAHETLVASALRTTRLRQSILKWAFEGRLVDQDPTDEPASRLLERIRAEREAKPAQRARTRRRARAAKSDRP
jgi:type I restriction enzyme S subunit